MKKSPNEELAEKVVAALHNAGFIMENRQEKVMEKLNDGSAKDSDWRFWIEETIAASEAAGAR